MNDRNERLVDLSVAIGAALIAALLAWQSLAKSADPNEEARAGVRLVEQAGIFQDAANALPAEVRGALDSGASTRVAEPPGSNAAALSHLEAEVLQESPAVELRLAWIALATSWREDARARAKIAELASDPAQLSTHRRTLDELLRLANGKGAEAIDALTATFADLGASRWTTAHLRERHLANIGDAAAGPLAAEIVAIAESAVTRWTMVGGLELFLFPSLGLIVLVLFPLFARSRLTARGLALDLVPSPFALDRTWRVFFGWFIAFQVLGLMLVLGLSALTSGPHLVALTMALQALASAVVMMVLIELWGRLPRDARSVPVALGLAKPRWWLVLLWMVPGLAVAMTVVRAADYLNLVVLQRPPDTQSVVQLVIDQSSPPLLALIALGAVVLAPFAEEVVFRGFLFRNLRDSLGKGLAMVVSGFAFAIIHFEPTLILPLTALGIGLALLYEWSGSLWVPIAVHALWNLFALVKIELWRI